MSHALADGSNGRRGGTGKLTWEREKLDQFSSGGDERVTAFRKRAGTLVLEEVLTAAFFAPMVGAFEAP